MPAILPVRHDDRPDPADRGLQDHRHAQHPARWRTGHGDPVDVAAGLYRLEHAQPRQVRGGRLPAAHRRDPRRDGLREPRPATGDGRSYECHRAAPRASQRSAPAEPVPPAVAAGHAPAGQVRRVLPAVRLGARRPAADLLARRDLGQDAVPGRQGPVLHPLRRLPADPRRLALHPGRARQRHASAVRQHGHRRDSRARSSRSSSARSAAYALVRFTYSPRFGIIGLFIGCLAFALDRDGARRALRRSPRLPRSASS